MKLSKKLCKQAQEGADSLAKRNAFAHDTENYRCGENLWMRSPPKSDKLTKEMSVSYCTSAVNTWYSEIDNYSFKKHGKKSDDGAIGHFTQLVWKKSVKLGVGIAKRRDGKYVVLCRYSPRGNMNMSKNLPEQIGDLK
ncbi:unnamed protein product [Oikopleura dioica]|nr:unnamed protein product [Oikopleura dioica]